MINALLLDKSQIYSIVVICSTGRMSTHNNEKFLSGGEGKSWRKGRREYLATLDILKWVKTWTKSINR